MSKITLDLQNKTLLEKLIISAEVASNLEDNNSLFPDPNPSVDEILDTKQMIEQKLSERNSHIQMTMALTVELNRLEAELDNLLKFEANYVESVCNGDSSIIIKSGFKVRKHPSPIGKLPGISNLSANVGKKPGEVELRWGRIKTAKVYTIESSESTSGKGEWKHIGLSTKAKFLVSGLTSGKGMMFRVAATGSNKQGPWSNPCGIFVP